MEGLTTLLTGCNSGLKGCLVSRARDIFGFVLETLNRVFNHLDNSIIQKNVSVEELLEALSKNLEHFKQAEINTESHFFYNDQPQDKQLRGVSKWSKEITQDNYGLKELVPVTFQSNHSYLPSS